mgnify:CR=1 FL=1
MKALILNQFKRELKASDFKVKNSTCYFSILYNEDVSNTNFVFFAKVTSYVGYYVVKRAKNFLKLKYKK